MAKEKPKTFDRAFFVEAGRIGGKLGGKKGMAIRWAKNKKSKSTKKDKKAL